MKLNQLQSSDADNIFTLLKKSSEIYDENLTIYLSSGITTEGKLKFVTEAFILLDQDTMKNKLGSGENIYLRKYIRTQDVIGFEVKGTI